MPCPAACHVCRKAHATLPSLSYRLKWQLALDIPFVSDQTLDNALDVCGGVNNKPRIIKLCSKGWFFKFWSMHTNISSSGHSVWPNETMHGPCAWPASACCILLRKLHGLLVPKDRPDASCCGWFAASEGIVCSQSGAENNLQSAPTAADQAQIKQVTHCLQHWASAVQALRLARECYKAGRPTTGDAQQPLAKPPTMVLVPASPSEPCRGHQMIA